MPVNASAVVRVALAGLVIVKVNVEVAPGVIVAGVNCRGEDRDGRRLDRGSGRLRAGARHCGGDEQHRSEETGADPADAGAARVIAT